MYIKPLLSVFNFPHVIQHRGILILAFAILVSQKKKKKKEAFRAAASQYVTVACNKEEGKQKVERSSASWEVALSR
jgi:hypothetical protein